MGCQAVAQASVDAKKMRFINKLSNLLYKRKSSPGERKNPSLS
ncbi:MAG: hypothetical protein ACRD8Z_04940 [Nitrososphaeraceae archaeon]